MEQSKLNQLLSNSLSVSSVVLVQFLGQLFYKNYIISTVKYRNINIEIRLFSISPDRLNDNNSIPISRHLQFLPLTADAKQMMRTPKNDIFDLVNVPQVN